MPHIPVPHRSGVHRVAAIALYRALLTQCRALPLVQQRQGNELQNIVRNRFKQVRHESSPRWLKPRFQAGYEAIDYLDAAVAGDEGSKNYILDLLERAPERVKKPPPVVIYKTLQRTIKKRNRASSESVERHGAEATVGGMKPSVFDRPFPLDELSGRRHVPVLFNAQGIPVLRIKKPQPQNLSSYINDRIEQRQKRHDLRHRIEDELEIAKLEDVWDQIVAEAAIDSGDGRGRAGGKVRVWDAREPQWSEELGKARKEINRILDEERMKNREMAEKMQGVVDREQQLFDEEKVARRTAKANRLRTRKRTSEASATLDVDAPGGAESS